MSYRRSGARGGGTAAPNDVLARLGVDEVLRLVLIHAEAPASRVAVSVSGLPCKCAGMCRQPIMEQRSLPGVPGGGKAGRSDEA